MSRIGCDYTEVLSLAKKISDEFFESGIGVDVVRDIAIKKYEKLKDITLN